MNKLRMFLENREIARQRGDLHIVRAMDLEMARMGYKPPERDVVPERETTQAVALAEQAVPEKPRRGRPPRPRCEHGMIPERCPDCSEEMLGVE